MLRRTSCLVACVVLAGTLAASTASPEIEEKARRLAVEAKFLLREDRLSEAVQKLELALELVPDHAAAKALLSDARSRLVRVDDLLAEAEEHRAAAAWDEALAPVTAAREIFPKHPSAAALETRIRREAAEAVVKDAALAGDWDDPGRAEALYRRALEFDHESAPAREGLCEVYVARGEAALADGRPGAALAWFEAAADVWSDGPGPARASAARATVEGRIRFKLAHDDSVAPATRPLVLAVRDRLVAAAPRFVDLSPPLPRVAARGYAWRVETDGVRLDDAVRREERVHTYTVGREAPNPEVDRVRALLDTALERLRIMQQDYDRDCPFCHGDGWVLCRVCRGTGRDPAHPADPCPACTGGRHLRPGFRRCGRCRGTGRYGSTSLRDLRTQEALVDRLQARLAATPLTVIREEPATWPYTIEHHERTGRLQASAEVLDLETGRRRPAGSASPRLREADTAVQRSNPGIGIPPDSLDLPAAEEMERVLLDRAAETLAEAILGAALADRKAALDAEAEALRARGEVFEALERRADAALPARALDPQADPFEAIREALRTVEASGPARGASRRR